MKFVAQAIFIALAVAQVVSGVFIEIVNPPPGGPRCNIGSRPKCLDVQGAKLANGTVVQIYDCNCSNAQDWDFRTSGPTSIKLRNTNFCLDAGSNPGNGVHMKIWQCFNNLPAQTWSFDNNKHIVLQGKGQCLDLTNGVTTNGNPVQTWQCVQNNQNQVWVPLTLP
ncbi:hypothetical protein D9756_002812 [Leucocoprinus leucothites]|uniref:Ricin B lectin domain-containing protein n=1 Tax=Leucocoprinus leucothites TaxID=201217 RepID=A0A8H5LM76_9AGAR|nr:hypothetical protein D9756_002812 [Leucoagaricus leucothites]